MSKISAVITHFYDAREPNLQVIANALRSGPVQADEILIWNNAAPIAPIAGVDIVQSPHNVGCQARFLAALLSRGDYVLFHDNDMACQPNTLARLLYWSEEFRLQGCIVSIDGWRFDKHQDYTHGVEHLFCGDAIDQPHQVDVTPGHIELVDRVTLMRVLQRFPFEETSVMDDLIFCAAAKACHVPRFVVPCEFERLSDYGLGISREPGFNEERDDLCKQLFF